MQERLLNRRMTIKRKDITATGLSETGDILKSKEADIATGVKFRITTNSVSNEKQMEEPGGWSNSSYLGFSLVGVDIRKNDILEDESSGLRYLVVWNDKTPGGVSDSHYEVYINESRNE